MLRNCKRYSVDTPSFRRGVGIYGNPDFICGQRGNHKDDENPDFPSTNSAYRTQASFHSGNGGPESNCSQRDPRQGESSGPFNKAIAHDNSEELDESEFQRLIDEWLQ